MKTFSHLPQAQDITKTLRLKALELSADQLKEVAGSRPPPETSMVTSAGVTKCCW